MNVSPGQKGRKWTIITLTIQRRKSSSMSLRGDFSLIYVYIISNASQNQEMEGNEATHLLERFVVGTFRTNAHSSAVPGPTSSSLVPEYPNTYWFTTNHPQRQTEKLSLVREIVDAMPELDVIRLLYEVFVTRCQGPLGKIVHTPTFTEQAEIFCGCLGHSSPEAQVVALSSTTSMDTLACHLLAVRMPYRASSVCSPSPSLTARTRSRLSFHSISTWVVSYTSEPSCGRASSVRCTLQDVEVTCVALPSRKGCRSFVVRLLGCKLPSCFYSIAKRDQ